MDATVNDILMALETIAPVALAESWDNVGLQVGSRQWPVKRVLTALDLTPEVMAEARHRQADALVMHHPLIFSPLRSVDLDTPVGGFLQELLHHQIAVMSAHTNLDSVTGGVNDVLASHLKVDHLTVLQPLAEQPHCGLGRVGSLPDRTTLADLAVAIKSRMALPHIRFAGNPHLSIQRVALCSGSGSGLLDAFFASGAQVYITGDVRYHEAREVEARGLGVIDIGHYESEHIILESLAKQLAYQLTAGGLDVTVAACLNEQAPFKTV
jgi:GTP cyclohydrolase I